MANAEDNVSGRFREDHVKSQAGVAALSAEMDPSSFV